jgi:alkaline phosphatase D
MLETRLLARTRPLNYALDIPVYSTPWDFSNPDAPRAMALSEPQGQHTRMLRVPYEEVGGRLRSVFDWARVRAAVESPGGPPGGLQFVPDRKRLADMLNSPDRRMLGQQQEHWLARELDDAKANGVAWQLIGNQVLMAPVTAPDLHTAPEPAQLAAERASPGARQLMQFTRLPIPLNPDSWDGYPQSRARLLDLFRRLNGSVIVLSGDSHAAWVNELIYTGVRVAAEFGAPSVTSPGPGDLFASAGVDFAAGVRARNPHVKWTDHTKRGYLRLTLERTGALAEFMSVSNVQSTEFRVAREAAFMVTPGIGEIASARKGKERRK